MEQSTPQRSFRAPSAFAPARVLAQCAGLALCAALMAPAALASEDDGSWDIAPIAQRSVAWSHDSGLVASAGDIEEEAIVHATLVSVTGAPWMRLSLAGTTLGGDPAADGARLRITSMIDGGVQLLNGESLAQWHHTSAYMNGDVVLVEVLARGTIPASRLVIDAVTVGEGPSPFATRSICGATDDRVLSSDPRQARLMTVGCTAWMINDTNRSFLTAGHCGVTAASVVQFNVPLSTTGGATVNPPPQDQYVIDLPSNQGVASPTIGNDWRYFGVSVNSTTGLTPIQAQGATSFYTLGNAPAPAGQTLRITGYGTTSSPISLTWSQVQKTHTGGYTSLTGTTVRHTVDTTGGNSGSPIEINGGIAFGVHTNAGCTSSGGSNSGTALQNTGLQAALANPLSVARSGGGNVPTSSLYVIGDAANNFGRLSTTTGVFDAISMPGINYQGLAYDPISQGGRFFAINSARVLESINPDTGVSTVLGTVTGTTLTFNGLAYRPDNNQLYAYTASNGLLWQINPATRVASPIGGAAPRAIGGLDYNPTNSTLYALEDAGTNTRLLTISTINGAVTIVGNLGTGITDCNGLAVDPATGDLYTIDATTENLLRINPATGAATVVGTAPASTRGVFGAQYGMAWRYTLPPACDLDFNNDTLVPDSGDLDDFIAVLAGGPAACSTGPTSCDSVDFNRDTIFPDSDDLDAFIRALGGGC